MIRHPRDGKEITAAEFAKAYVETELRRTAEAWRERVAGEVLVGMSGDEAQRVEEEIHHLVRMIELRTGLAECEDVAAMWRADGDHYLLRKAYRHPGTAVRLAPVSSRPGRYAIRLENTASGEFIQSQKTFELRAAQEAATSMAYSEAWLEKIGIPKDHARE